MRFNVPYDVVVEFDYPLGEGTDLAYDTWARDLDSKVSALYFGSELKHRLVRTGKTVAISLKAFPGNAGDLTWAASLILGRVAAQAPGDVTIRFHDLGDEGEGGK